MVKKIIDNIKKKVEVKKKKKEKKEIALKFKDEVIKYFEKRRTIRKYSRQKVNYEDIYKIISCSLNSPAAGNVQNTSVIVIDNKKDIQEISKIAYDQTWMNDAKYLLIVIRKNEELLNLYGDIGLKYSIQNTAAVIENIHLCTHFFNLSSCWIGAYNEEALKSYLKIPVQYDVDAIITIGYPNEKPKVTKDNISLHLYFDTFENTKRYKYK